MKINPQSLAKTSATHPWRTLGIWLVVLAAGIAGSATLLGPALTTEFDFTNSPEAKRAEQVLQEELTGPDHVTETFIVIGADTSIEDPAFADHVNGILGEIADLKTGVAASRRRSRHPSPPNRTRCRRPSGRSLPRTGRRSSSTWCSPAISISVRARR